MHLNLKQYKNNNEINKVTICKYEYLWVHTSEGDLGTNYYYLS